ncbi:MAG: NAD(P)-dependent oxidoreductase [Legionella sp.]|nr:NAD(P)-dependent oxidoreductase [Legionella sp.]
MNIAWIGTGAMGIPMARHLIQSGHTLKVYNRTAAHAKSLVELGAESTATPKEAVKNADMVFCIVTNNEASRAVWEDENGIVAGLKEGAIAIECSTVTPAHADHLRKYVSNNSKALFLTAPVIGTYKDAENKELLFLVGGDLKTLEIAQPILALMSKMVLHVGNDQQTSALKLAVTASVSTQILLQTELLQFLKSYDLTAEMINLFQNLPFTAAVTELINTLMEPVGAHGNGLFPLDLVHKDLGYIVESQSENNQTSALTSAARDAYGNQNIRNRYFE